MEKCRACRGELEDLYLCKYVCYCNLQIFICKYCYEENKEALMKNRVTCEQWYKNGRKEKVTCAVGILNQPRDILDLLKKFICY